MAELLPATPYQAMHLLASEMAGKDSHGTNMWVVSLGGALSLDRLTAAWGGMLRRHPPLMVRFHHERGTILQELRSIRELPDESARIHRAAPDRVVGYPPVEGLAPFGPQMIRGWLLDRGGDSTDLLIAAHHAVTDDESLRIAIRTLTEVLAGGASEPPAESPRRYRHTVQALLSEAERARSGESRRYWARLLGERVSSAVPRWHAGRPTARESGGRYETNLDAHDIDVLRAAARRNRVTPAMLVHAALAVIWYRYDLGERVAVGTPLSLRDHLDVGFDATGLYLNVLPLVSALSGDDTFGNVLARLRQELVGLQRHKFTPLIDLAEVAGVDQSSVAYSVTAYFGSTLSVRVGPPSCLPGARVRSLGQVNPGSMVHIDVAGDHVGGHMTLSWRDECRLWPEPSQVTAHLRRIIQVMFADPATRVGGFPLADVSPSRQLARTLTTTGAGPGSRPRPSCLVLAIGESWRRRPAAPAIVDGAVDWTFGDLRRAVEDARALLRGRIAALGDRVGVACGRSRWQIAFALAAWCEGLCYVPLDPKGPPARTRYLCRDADVRVAIALTPDGVDRTIPCEVLSPGHLTQPVKGAGATTRVQPAAGHPERPPRPTDLAYVMYTSGSSGQPKGVAITHGNLESFIDAFAEAFPATRKGRWLAETAPTFDISLLEMFWPLSNGQTVVLSDPDLGAGGTARLRFSHRQCTPSRARQILTARQAGEETGQWRVAPHTWLIGGEVMPPALVRDLRAAYPTTTFANMYGPTEATIWSTFHVITGDEVDDDVPIGEPFGNSAVTVLDRHGHPAPPGVVGELLIAGDGVSPGYLDRPDLTARAFSDVGMSDRQVRAYRTGDLAVVGPSGQLHFRGRTDRQVKLLGHRIELDEVERALSDDPEVTEATVDLHAHGAGETLCAIIAGLPGRSPDGMAVIRRLAERLPAGMVPTHVSVVAELPRLPSGKIDRRGSARSCAGGVGAQGSSPDPAAAPPPPGLSPANRDGSSATASVLLEVARRLLGREVDPHDDFFVVGGNSLSALALVAEAKDQGLDVQLHDVLEYRTVSRIAAHLDTSGASRSPA